MQIKLQQGYPDYIGRRWAWCGSGAGPSSYDAVNGDPLEQFRFNNYIDTVFPGMSVSGNYRVFGQPSVVGPRPTWTLRWEFARAGSVASVTGTGGSGMTAGTYALAFSGGGGSGAAGTITVTASAITAIVITNPGSGYTSAPTVSATTGGTAPTLTAVLSAGGEPVASGANLSGESVQLGGFGGDY